MPEKQDPPPLYLPTSVVLAYLLTVLAWEVEVGLVALTLFGPRKVNPVGLAALLALTVSLTAFAYVKGRHHYARLRWTRGRIPLTRFQTFAVVVVMISFGVLLTFIAGLLF
jgi:hypothetical protein